MDPELDPEMDPEMDPELDPDPDLLVSDTDSHQNVTDPQHWNPD
jgi:hypothetical protein